MLKPRPDARSRRVAVQIVTMQMVRGPWMAETHLMRSMIGVYLCVDEYYITLSLPSRLANDDHTPPRPGAAYSGTTTSFQKPTRLPKASMVDAIKSHLIKLLRTSSLGVTEKKH
jgi:hypothetical protein